MAGFGELDQCIVSSLFVAGIHGFRDPVGEEYDHVQFGGEVRIRGGIRAQGHVREIQRLGRSGIRLRLDLVDNGRASSLEVVIGRGKLHIVCVVVGDIAGRVGYDAASAEDHQADFVSSPQLAGAGEAGGNVEVLLQGIGYSMKTAKGETIILPPPAAPTQALLHVGFSQSEKPTDVYAIKPGEF